MTETNTLPSVGDEVMEGKTRAVVTDIRGGVVWLRRQGGGSMEWPAEDPRRLIVRRTRTEMIKDGDL
ncbi:hypothetical protein [Streptomyces sp. NEAU-S7GS2]|uniref:hypothetical protein n=1 Tax=Streptomyces sp. NEAU-S7GS2 TaxID=2202000 RepID=UPI000D6F4B05|nr:hypothetical protein [Streptomyces sp. NEAU-S7GS2]AWN32628.1 hypothetical protein DKG71_42380 [Streptomyces sp. NEAU-S7GS2]